jgi:hypothetical protein
MMPAKSLKPLPFGRLVSVNHTQCRLFTGVA